MIVYFKVNKKLKPGQRKLVEKCLKDLSDCAYLDSIKALNQDQSEAIKSRVSHLKRYYRLDIKDILTNKTFDYASHLFYPCLSRADIERIYKFLNLKKTKQYYSTVSQLVCGKTIPSKANDLKL